MHWSRSGIAVALLASLGILIPAPLRALGSTPMATPMRCPFKIDKGLRAGKDVVCGYVVVPENHDRPSARTIKIPYAIFKSHSPNHQPDPIISLQGGPGGAWLDELGPAITPKSASLYYTNRDLVLIDQRGTGFATPSLACNPPAKKEEDPLKHTTSEQDAALQLKIYAQCHDQLVGRGVDLSVYNTIQDAADIDAVRQALGYEQVDLYGVSYGTELVLQIMRAFPTHIRSAVLDSVVPTGSSLILDSIPNPIRGLDALFAGCAASPTCASAYPQLENTFYTLVGSLDTKPVTISVKDLSTGKATRQLLTGQGFAGDLVQAEYSSELVPVLPLVIAATARGSYNAAAVLASIPLSVAKLVNESMYYSVECSESAPYTTAAQVSAAVAKTPQPFQHDTLVGTLAELQLCSAWHVAPVPLSFKQPVRSAIPTLLLAGAYDPITPVANAKRVARTLTTHYLYEFPANGHGQQGSGTCPSAIIASFQDHPQAAPDASCLSMLSGPKWYLPTS